MLPVQIVSHDRGEVERSGCPIKNMVTSQRSRLYTRTLGGDHAYRMTQPRPRFPGSTLSRGPVTWRELFHDSYSAGGRGLGPGAKLFFGGRRRKAITTVGSAIIVVIKNTS